MSKWTVAGRMRLMSDATSNPVPSSPPEPHYQPLVIVLVAVAVGILLDQYRPLPLEIWWAIAIGGFAAWLALAFNRRLPGLGKLLLCNVALLLAVAAIAAGWHHYRWHLCARDDLGCYATRKCSRCASRLAWCVCLD